MKELPNVFKGTVSNNTNQTSSIINSNDNNDEEKSIKEQIHDVFSSNSFVYKTDTLITLKTGEILKKTIIGKTNDSLITFDDELIEVSSISHIKII